jgi:hypothetical protein
VAKDPRRPRLRLHLTAVDPKYAKETPAKARVHTCIDQYKNNKSTNANGGLKWIQKGGGYYGECNKRLGGISSSPVLTQDGEEPDRYTAMARGAFYEVGEDPANQGKADDIIPSKCVYRNKEKFLCPDTERIAFERHYRTRDYDFLVISNSFSGSGNRWWEWKLIIENGKRAIAKPLAQDCLECNIQVERLNFQSNEIVFTHRQKKQLQTATFRAGQFTLRKSKLDPHEPLDEDTCDQLFGIYEEGCTAGQDTANCRMAQSNASHFGLMRTDDRYAGFSYEGMERQCKAACSSGKTMGRKTFFKKVCRR